MLNSTIKKQIRAIVSDLDGTFFNAEHEFPEYNLQQVKKAIDLGYKFAVATGRHPKDIDYIFKQIDYSFPIVGCNGALIYDDKQNIIYKETLEADVLQEIISFTLKEIANEPGIYINKYQGNTWYMNAHDERVNDFHKDSKFYYEYKDFNLHNSLEDNTDIIKVFILNYENSPRFKEILEAIMAKFGEQVYITYSNNYSCFEIMSKKINKKKGINYIFKQENLTIEQALCFGDAGNDYEMLSHCAYACIMGNADTSLKESLKTKQNHEIIGKNIDCGVGKFLAEFLKN